MTSKITENSSYCEGASSEVSSGDCVDRLTPFSINSAAKVEYQIANQAHWYDALRVAENIICEKQDAIEYAKIAQKEQEQKIRYQEVNLSKFPQLEQITILADIGRWTVDLKKQKRLIEDAEFELATALLMKQKILDAHPEIAKMDYSEIQKIASKEAYLETKARQIVTTILGIKYNLPSEICDFLLQGDEEVIDRVTALMPSKAEKIQGEIPKLVKSFDRQNKQLIDSKERAKLESMLNE